ncbi:MAG TPA: helix-turn-helix transcriptional regulator [Acidimicrobiales bacterium]|jgi:PadR family transcriptional regulator, regulatory protein PadR|nr:helix-turn-helix transcriptional regulator [Acidimicrobiales bacterium]
MSARAAERDLARREGPLEPSRSEATKSPTRSHGRDDGLPRGYLRACLLLLVAEAPVHGYELVAQLGDLGVGRPDAATVYRTLRGLDEEGLVSSWWASPVAGPARRVYRTTVAGRHCLVQLVGAVEDTHLHLSAFLHRHRALGPAAGRTGDATSPCGGRPR